MPDIEIVKFKARRGTDNQRLNVVLDEGEIGYTTDGKRLFVGDGATTGGISQTTKIHPPYTPFENTNGFVGDVVYRSNLLWQLTGSNASLSASWAYIGPQVDNTSVQFNSAGALSVNSSGIPLNANGGIISSGGLAINVDNDTVEIDSNILQVKTGGITTSQLADSIFAVPGTNNTPIVKSDDGNTITLKYNTSNFQVVNNILSLLSVNRANIIQLMEGSIAYGSMYIDAGGKLLVYGQDTLGSGALGIGSPLIPIQGTPAEPIFSPPLRDDSIKSVVGSYGTSFAVTNNGNVYVTGQAPQGYTTTNYSSLFQLLCTNQYTPLTGIDKIVASPISNLTYLSASYFAIDSDNSLIYSWGYNGQYQLGLGHNNNVVYPTLIQSLTSSNIIDITSMCGISSTSLESLCGTTFAISQTGVYAVGANNYGQLGIGQSINNLYATNFTLIQPTTAEEIKQVICSSDAVFFLSVNGTVSAAGRNPWSQDYSSTSNVYLTALSAVPGLSNIKKLAVSQTPLSGSRFALNNDGNLYVWGNNRYGALGTPWSFGLITTPSFALSGISDIFTGGYSVSATTSFYINTSGGIYGTGYSGAAGPGGFGSNGNTWQYTFTEIPLPKLATNGSSINDIKFKYVGFNVPTNTPIYSTEILLNTGQVLTSGLTLYRNTSAFMLGFNPITF